MSRRSRDDEETFSVWRSTVRVLPLLLGGGGEPVLRLTSMVDIASGKSCFLEEDSALSGIINPVAEQTSSNSDSLVCIVVIMIGHNNIRKV
mmetsp:Transcript_40668/g.47583  ORF Transcript_40668/g.47583 Transcript_40668/m.47583 type:complete len:91 (+) Transcript_40668:889-1161(+)